MPEFLLSRIAEAAPQLALHIATNFMFFAFKTAYALMNDTAILDELRHQMLNVNIAPINFPSLP